MIPPHTHIRVDILSKVGALASSTLGAPVTQGAGVFGIQGMGVRAPIAAAVADATVGFSRDVHIPKGMILTIGAWSIMLASGTWSV